MQEKMTESEMLEFIAKTAREISRPTHRPRRRQPKMHGRVISWRQKIALGQEGNDVKAIYEPDRNPTPIRSDESTIPLTREVGPGDEYNPMWALQRLERGDSGHA